MKNEKCCAMGTYDCSVTIPNPPLIFGYKKEVFADICLVPAIQALWKLGFKTVASCCGHGKVTGRIDFEKTEDKTNEHD